MDVLKNKAYRSYDKLSRYSSFPFYFNMLDNKYVYGIVSQLNDSTPYISHAVKLDETFDDIALEYYGNPTYYWIITDFNRVQDPYSELKEGQIIKIPVLSSIEFV